MGRTRLRRRICRFWGRSPAPLWLNHVQRRLSIIMPHLRIVAPTPRDRNHRAVAGTSTVRGSLRMMSIHTTMATDFQPSLSFRLPRARRSLSPKVVRRFHSTNTTLLCTTSPGCCSAYSFGLHTSTAHSLALNGVETAVARRRPAGGHKRYNKDAVTTSAIFARHTHAHAAAIVVLNDALKVIEHDIARRGENACGAGRGSDTCRPRALADLLHDREARAVPRSQQMIVQRPPTPVRPCLDGVLCTPGVHAPYCEEVCDPIRRSWKRGAARNDLAGAVIAASNLRSPWHNN
ncbi:hypothetical protein B0H17DRAFT_431317 [Mycena rosella]|uniref:Uncharacterized protein n=1 Tax=Mycena rosella TaxID=1033263 RepID=A0AAD7GHH9_MYCRO|nr:hypothetical protein B0H17DRAFT_431317 [Mycena rosella]